MNQRTEVEQAKANALKVARSAIRLRKSIEADEEINRQLPKFEEEFDRRVARGELPDPVTMLEALDA